MTGPRDDDHAAHLRDLLAGRASGGLESGGAGTGPPPEPDEVAQRVADTVERMRDYAPDEIGDPQEFRAALEILLRESQRAARALASPDPLGPDELHALEAVIATDGTRPSLLIRDASFDPDHPLAAGWTSPLDPIHRRMGPIARAIGRIEPQVGSANNFFGTGWVVSTADRLVLTNMHVLELIWSTLPQMVTPADGHIDIHDGVYIDFAGESGRDGTQRFRVVQATPTTVDGPTHVRFDAAVLRIEATDAGQQVPEQIPVAPDLDAARGNRGDVYLVGFPGPPRQFGLTRGRVNWATVYRALFGNIFGVKRFAPGLVHRPVGSLPVDQHKWVFGHDATTLGGSSGSPVVTFVDDAPAAVGLHYAGASESTNYAHAFSRTTTELAALGVPLPGGGDHPT